MKISYSWLKDYIKTELPAEEVGKLLTSGGLEVEEINSYSSIVGSLDQVIIAEVISKEKHPDADKLSVTQVNTGSETLQIVCGAPNVAAGQKVILAMIGSTLTTSTGEKIAIKKSKIRGIESHGMICAEDELGLGTSHEGILVLPPDSIVGTAAADYFKIVNDEVIEIGLTPNRGDAYSHIGTARDLKALLRIRLDQKCELQLPNTIDTASDSLASNPISLSIVNNAKCKRYSGVYIENVIVKDSPEWIQNRLKAIGVRPINNIVDIGNYILHEYGQPLHAFDASKIKDGKLIVRDARDDEEFITLDDKKINLSSKDLVIADEEKALCIAGVYGSNNSGINAASTQVYLESASFDSSSIRVSGTKLNLRTEASMHFEKGTDIDITVEALKRALYLLKEDNPSIRFSAIYDSYPEIQAKTIVAVSYKNIERLIGIRIEPTIIHELLQALDFELSNLSDSGFDAAVPSCKTEVTREADIIEEILRIYGFDKIPVPSVINASLTYREQPDKVQVEISTAQFLSANGFNEMMSNPISQSLYFAESENLVKLANSMTAELDCLRPHLIFGALESIAYNMNRKNSKIRLFEWGSVFEKKDENFVQKNILGIYLSGPLNENNWNLKSQKSSFFDLKSIVEELLSRNHIADFDIETAHDNKYNTSTLLYKKGEKTIAELGIVKRTLTQKMDIKEDVFVAFIDWKLLLDAQKKKKVKYQPVSKFPQVKRDLALLVAKSCSYEALKKTSEKVLKNMLKEIALFDMYEGDKIAEGKKSYAISYLLGDDHKTLTDKDIDKVMQKLIETLSTEHEAVLRQ